jgi:hypothetical protein
MSSSDDTEDGPALEKGWEELAKNLIRAEMMRRGASFAVLAERLEAIGVKDNELNLRNKVGRGRFTAVFMLQCFKALGVEWIQIPESLEEGGKQGGAQALARRERAPKS